MADIISRYDISRMAERVSNIVQGQGAPIKCCHKEISSELKSKEDEKNPTQTARVFYSFKKVVKKKKKKEMVHYVEGQVGSCIFVLRFKTEVWAQ